MTRWIAVILFDFSTAGKKTQGHLIRHQIKAQRYGVSRIRESRRISLAASRHRPIIFSCMSKFLTSPGPPVGSRTPAASCPPWVIPSTGPPQATATPSVRRNWLPCGVTPDSWRTNPLSITFACCRYRRRATPCTTQSPWVWRAPRATPMPYRNAPIPRRSGTARQATS